MIKKYNFSLIELLTVIIVILILMTLIAPSINRLRAKSRIVLCANQMKQVGVLISTYALDQNGYLPYSGDFDFDNELDIKGNKLIDSLYGCWAGHLLPYFNLNLESYSRENVYYDEEIDGITEPDKINHQLVKDMMYEGGFGSLKLLICPDAINTMDANSLKSGNEHPRISSTAGSTDRWRETGVPTSYLGNGDLFGHYSTEEEFTSVSMRLEDVNKQNIMLAEGCNFRHQYGGQQTFYTSPGNNAYSYAGTFNMRAYYGGSNEIASDTVLFSFMHDETKELWVSNFPSSQNFTTTFVKIFNSTYQPYAAASKDYDAPEFNKGVLASSVYPGEDWSLYKNILEGREFKIEAFHSEDSKKSYYFGSMNMLGADLSVTKRHIGWLYENAHVLTSGE